MLKTTEATPETNGYQSPARLSDTANATTPTATSNPKTLSGNAAEPVRLDELAEALKVLEREKRQTTPTTAPLGEVLESLDNSANVEEVWKRVQELRQRKQSKGKKSGSKNLIQLGIGIFAFATVAVATGYVVQRLSNIQDKPVEIQQQATPNIVKYQAAVDGTVQFGSGPFIYRSPTMKPVSDFKFTDSIPIHRYNLEELQKLTRLSINKADWKNLFAETKPSPGDFPVVRIGDKFYLRGWTTGKPGMFSGNVNSIEGSVTNNGRNFTLFNNPKGDISYSKSILPPPPPAGASPKEIQEKYTYPTIKKYSGGPANVQIQIPLDALGDNIEVVENEVGASRIEVSLDPKKLDNHAWEAWPNPKYPPAPLRPGFKP